MGQKLGQISFGLVSSNTKYRPERKYFLREHLDAKTKETYRPYSRGKRRGKAPRLARLAGSENAVAVDRPRSILMRPSVLFSYKIYENIQNNPSPRGGGRDGGGTRPKSVRALQRMINERSLPGISVTSPQKYYLYNYNETEPFRSIYYA